MNQLTAVAGSPDTPEPLPKKLSRAKRRELAKQAAGDLGLLNVSPEVLAQISTLGMHMEDVGPGQIARGIFVVTYDECERALRDIQAQMSEIDAMPEKAPEDRDRRIVLMRMRLDYTGEKRSIADGMNKSKPADRRETIRAKSVTSFPANLPIPPMSITETVVVKVTDSE